MTSIAWILVCMQLKLKNLEEKIAEKDKTIERLNVRRLCSWDQRANQKSRARIFFWPLILLPQHTLDKV